MNVRFENMCNRHARFSRHVDVNVTVRPRIEHRRNAFIIVPDEIRKLGDTLGLNGLENERHLPELTRSRARVQQIVIPSGARNLSLADGSH